MSKDNVYLADILESARVVQQHVAGMSREQFLVDVKTQDAGGASRHLSPETLKALPDVPWKLIVGMRNVLIHDYDDVDPKRVWDDTQKDIPVLIQRFELFLVKQAADGHSSD